MNDFYIYIHRKASDNTPFYVGKGRKGRAWTISGRSKHWNNTVNKHGLIVDIVFEGLTEEDDFQCEIDTILELKYFGYALVNLTNGGEGVSGFKQSDGHKKRAALSRKNSSTWQEGIKRAALKNKGRQLTEKHKLKISESMTGRKCSDTVKSNMREARNKSARVKEHIATIAGANKDTNIYLFVHKDGENFLGTRKDFSVLTGLDPRQVNKLFGVKTKRKSVHGWSIDNKTN